MHKNNDFVVVDLQFQLVFSKGGISLLHSGSDSSPEDDIKPKVNYLLTKKNCVWWGVCETG